jgi:hypothetical protein
MTTLSLTPVRGVVDMTFLDIYEEGDLSQALTTKFAPASPDQTIKSPGKKKAPETIKAIRLGNNEISSIDILYKSISTTLDGTNILWIDLSFNQITKISDGIAKTFPNLATLNLHANKLSRLSEIKKLASVLTLKSVSLHGNSIEEHKHYRNYCLFMCPNLRQFDMSPVTAGEIARMKVWAETYRHVLHKDDDEEYYA